MRATLNLNAFATHLMNGASKVSSTQATAFITHTSMG